MKTIYFTSMIFLIVISFSCKSEPLASASKVSNFSLATIVKTVSLNESSLDQEVLVQGVVLSKGEAKPAFKTGGVIQRTYFTEGQSIRRGQILATLIMDEINAQVIQAEEGLKKAERDYNRAKNLYADSVATLEQYQNATTAYEFAKRTVDMARFNKQYSEVRAPIDGKIIKQLARTGEIVGPGMPVCYILGNQSSDWVIRAGLVDRDWARVAMGSSVQVSLDAYPGQSFMGKIIDKSQVIAGSSGTFDIEIKLDKQPSKLAAGLLARVKIRPTAPQKLKTIPVEALVSSDGNIGTVFTIENGKAKLLEINISELLGDKVAVASGLDKVTELITTGALFLEDGDPVTKL
jgi:membrane fusion protein, multidrug efflux system